MREDLWFFGGTIRTTMVRKIRGGVSAAAAALVALFFGQPPAPNFSFGVSCHCSAGVVMLTAHLGAILADEGALRALLSVKGASGTRPCFKCVNVVATNSGIEGTVSHLSPLPANPGPGGAGEVCTGPEGGWFRVGG